ncbi:protein ACCELERATED CELL DEATH 6-like [Macadamia integrifolia]|uniref:protein ACCELERATED CELL DEATH 6-like n=1 Tax=Macadamia integrifolia TaxID=60698 RepID=UPI001C4EC832|nr:protein ACCELERATED CELL DEATH 6-like [Macadamia integrifolia]
MAQTSNGSNALGYRDAYRAAIKGDLATLMEFCSKHSNMAVPINASGDTVYHVLGRNFHAKVVSELLLKFPYHDLMTMRNSEEETALHEAARVGCIEIADLIFQKQDDLITVRNKLGATPIFEAAAFGQEKMLRFFFNKRSYSGNYDDLRRNSDGSTILHAAVLGEFYGLALLIMETYPDLCLAPNETGITALHLLAQSPSSFRSGTIYSWLNLGSSTFISLEILAVTIYSCVPIDVSECIKEDPEDPHQGLYGRMKQLFKSLFRSLPWLKQVIDAKQKHKNALEVVKRLVATKSKLDPTLKYYENHGDEDEGEDPLLQATKFGIIEIVQVILEEFPDAIEVRDKISGKNMLHLVAEFRQDKIFEFLQSQKLPTITTKMLLQVDKKENTPLHLAAKYGFHQRRHVIPILNLMPSEMFWFKHIRQISPRQIYHLQNAKSQTPQELFDKTHYDLLQKSEKWVKENAGVYMVISTLIASLMFTAAFTVPGGFNSDTGLPVLIHNKYLLPYFRLVSLSLFFSLATLATSLYTHCIHFQQEDFYFSLPLKIFLSSSNLFCCVISTVLALLHYFFEAIRFFALLLALLVCVDVMLPVCRFLKKLLFHSLSSHN